MALPTAGNAALSDVAGPGRANSQIGAAIAQLGATALAEGKKLDDFKFKAAQVDLENGIRLNIANAEQEIEGDGSGYMAKKLPEIDSSIDAFKQQFPHRSNEADLIGKRVRGGAALNLHHVTQSHIKQYVEGETGRLLQENVAPMVTRDATSIANALATSENIIKGAENLNPTQRRRLQAKAAELAFDNWIAQSDPEDAAAASKAMIVAAPKGPPLTGNVKKLERMATKGVRLDGVNSNFKNRVAAMVDAMPQEMQNSIVLHSGFRDPNKQAEIVMRKLKERGIAITRESLARGVPGIVAGVTVNSSGKVTGSNSRHARGEAFDITGNKAAMEWMHKNGPKFGVINPPTIRKSDPGHFQMIHDGQGSSAHGFFVEKLIKGQRGMAKAAKEGRENRVLIESLGNEEYSINPYDTDVAKIANRTYEKLTGGADILEGGKSQAIAEKFAARGFIPEAAVNSIRQGLASTDAAKVTTALQAAQRLDGLAPNAFSSRNGGTAIQKAADVYEYRVQDLGYTPDQAAQSYIRDNDPEEKRKLKALEPHTKEFLNGLELGDVTGHFDDGFFSFAVTNLDVGFDPSIHGPALLADYKALARMEFEKTGNAETAKAAALKQMSKRLYGVTRLTGRPVLMKYPPEKFVQPADVPLIQQKLNTDIEDSTGRKIVAAADLQMKGVSPAAFKTKYGENPIFPEDIRLVSDDHTARTVRERGRNTPGGINDAPSRIEPEYRVIIMREEDGQKIMESPGYFSLQGIDKMRDMRLRKAGAENKELGREKMHLQQLFDNLHFEEGVYAP